MSSLDIAFTTAREIRAEAARVEPAAARVHGRSGLPASVSRRHSESPATGTAVMSPLPSRPGKRGARVGTTPATRRGRNLSCACLKVAEEADA